MKLINISILTTAATANMERRFSFLTFLSTEPRITLASNPLEKLMQLMDPYIYDLDREEITNKEIPEKTSQRSTKFMQLNYSHLQILKLKIWSLFGYVFLSTCYLITNFCYLTIRVFSLSFFLKA